MYLRMIWVLVYHGVRPKGHTIISVRPSISLLVYLVQQHSCNQFHFRHTTSEIFPSHSHLCLLINHEYNIFLYLCPFGCSWKVMLFDFLLLQILTSVQARSTVIFKSCKSFLPPLYWAARALGSCFLQSYFSLHNSLLISLPGSRGKGHR